jgi:beta-xylosidase
VQKFDGSSWSTVGGGPVSAFSATEHFDSGNPDLAVVNGTFYLAWEESDQYEGPFIYVARWDSSASQWILDGDKLNIDTTRTAHDPSLAYSSGDNTLYIAFEEYISGWPEIFVKYKQPAP